MNTMINMNPWSFLDELLDANSRAYRSVRARAAGRFPPVNVYVNDRAIVVDVELPGKTAKDVELSLEAQAMVVADRPPVKVDGEGKPLETVPAWSRRLELPFRVDSEKAKAKFLNGVLRIELPKAEAPGVHRIVIGE